MRIGIGFAALVFSVVTFNSFAHANEPAAQEQWAQKQLEKDGKEIGGSFNFTTNRNGSIFRVAPFLGYFIYDNVSIDGVVGLTYTDSKITSDFIVGGTHYFKVADRYAPFVSQNVSFTLGDGSPTFYGSSNAGVAYFLLPNVAFKTIASLSYGFKDISETFSFSVLGGFSFYYR